WKFSVFACAISTLLVFAVNLAATIWAISRHGFGGAEGRQTLYEGNCVTAGKLNTGIHFVINTLSTILLGSSNYCMQCLSAPTRKEVDIAHSKRKWLDIGVLSTRNLRGIATKRVVFWWLLGISSLPLHLFILFDWEQQVLCHTSDKGFCGLSSDGCIFRLRELKANGELEQLDNLACINAYSRQFQTRGSVLVVTQNTSIPAVLRSKFGSPETDAQWVCSEIASMSCDISPGIGSLRANSSSWKPFGVEQSIAYCLSERVPEQCKVQSSLYLAIVVIVLNLIKAFVMFSLAVGVKEMPLMTIGDAIASFLCRPDPSSESMCLISKKDIKRGKNSWLKGPMPFKSRRRRLFAAASKTRLSLCMFINNVHIYRYLVILGIVGWLLSLAIQEVIGLGGDLQTIRQLGLGKVQTMTILGLLGVPNKGAAGLIVNAIIANSPQPILSFMYFSYNGLFTSFSGVMEWGSYSRRRKALRVSDTPYGEQRCTYFLQLPYRIALPLMAFSGLLHWLLSQSIFLVNVQTYTYSSVSKSWRDPSGSNDVLSCGYSPLGIILVLGAEIVMILALIVTGSLRFKTDTPVVGSCSIAIAAACHVPAEEDDPDTYISKVQWGVTGNDANGVGHCSFSRWPVTPPEDGMLYQ
ncbi:uncharacterized protein BDR25DRAFT_195847, partial [Lindgomyces ingoldianus]